MKEQIIPSNRYTFGLGTVGRDMVYSMVSMYLIFYLTDILKLSDSLIINVTTVMLCARIFDALNDPIMGTIVDNTKTRWGKFKPWIVIGAILAGILTILLFTEIKLTGAKYVTVFAIIYVSWGIAFTMNDISYWSMMPALSKSQSEREKIGAMARICANVGLFTVVAGIVPLTNAIGAAVGSMSRAYTIFALILVGVLWVFQAITVIWCKEPNIENDKKQLSKEERTTLGGMFKAIVKNDQLLFTAISMSLFQIGYMTTTSFGLYFFKYAYKNEGMYSIFAVILGVSQLLALIVFPIFSKRFTRKQIFTGSIITVFAGYIVFFFSPMNMIPIGIAGVLLFFGQAFIQLLMLVFLTDTVEYGEWKLGKRNESVTFSLQPFINKMGGAISSGIVGYIVVVSGINSAATPDDVTNTGLMIMKIAMLIFPLFAIGASYLIYRFKYKIDKAYYNELLEKLAKRKEEQAK